MDPIQELRAKGVVITGSDKCLDAATTAEMVKMMLGCHSLTEYNVVNSMEIVLLLDTEEETTRLLYLDSFSKGGSTYFIRRWKPITAGGEPEWLKLKQRTIEVTCVPEHLWSLDVLQTLCKDFGRVDSLILDLLHKYKVSITVSDCNILKIL